MVVSYKSVTFSASDVITESGGGTLIKSKDAIILDLDMGKIEVKDGVATITRKGIMPYQMKLEKNVTFDCKLFKVTARKVEFKCDDSTFNFHAEYDILTDPTLNVKIFVSGNALDKKE